MEKRNCWEVKKCGQQNGSGQGKATCPVILEQRLNGVHGGTSAGRACWVVAGTFCGGVEQGTFASKYHNCEKCDFYNQVKREEGPRYELSIMLLKRLRDTGAPIGR